MLDASPRTGEVLVNCLRDFDLDAPIPLVRISETIVSHKGESTHRQELPESARSVCRVALPVFALRSIGAYLEKIRFTHPDTLLCSTRAETPHTTCNIRSRLLDVMDQAGVSDLTPNRFRRTAATAINEIGGLQVASEILEHLAPSITSEHYIRPNETVNPITADFLDQAFGKAY